MEEAQAKSFTDSIDLNEDGTPTTLRVLPKKPGTSLHEVPDTEWAAYLSEGTLPTYSGEWETLASQLREKGYQVVCQHDTITAW